MNKTTEPKVITVPDNLYNEFDSLTPKYISCGGDIVGVVLNPHTFSNLKAAFRPLQRFNG